MRTFAAGALLLLLAGCSQAGASSHDCASFEQSETRLQTARDQANAAYAEAQRGFVDPTKTAQAKAQYVFAARAYAELVAGDACATSEDRARARADLDGIGR